MHLPLIASLLLQLYTGMRPNKREFEAIYFFLMGWGDTEELALSLVHSVLRPRSTGPTFRSVRENHEYMTDIEQQIRHLRAAESQFRLGSAVRLATTFKEQPRDLPLEWTHGKHRVQYDEIIPNGRFARSSGLLPASIFTT
jgi:hypothetical protein